MNLGRISVRGMPGEGADLVTQHPNGRYEECIRL